MCHSQTVSWAAAWPLVCDSQGPSLAGSFCKERRKEEENPKKELGQ